MNRAKKHITLEELRKYRHISNSNGRPGSRLTDETWQKEFEIRKMFVTPYKNGSTKKLSGAQYQKCGNWNEERDGVYQGATNWQEYCAYINDVLQNIRTGKVDYCYYIFQITDLLKFHYDDLQTRYCDGYWEVWLDKERSMMNHGKTILSQIYL